MTDAPVSPLTEIHSPDAFVGAIDRRWDATQSIVLRYRNAVRLESAEDDDALLKSLFDRTSIREGVRVVPLFTHRDVEVSILDETSLMHTGTLKSIDGCVTTAHCLLRGHQRVVFESGGNTGTALTTYARRLGIETFFFLPSENVSLLDKRFFDDEAAHVIAVDRPRDVKPTAANFAARNGVRRIPELGWRIQASTFVGCFLLEHLLEHGPYDVLAQSISAAFGPVGIYRVLDSHREGLDRLPSFLGVQQASNCPMVRAWKNGSPRGDAPLTDPIESTTELLARVMYDGEPGTYGTLEPLRRILIDTGGDLTTVDHDEFRRGVGTIVQGKSVLDHLADHGIEITLRNGEVLEKAGLMALVGVLRGIDGGGIAAGKRVLVCVTGGTARPGGAVHVTRWSDLETTVESARD